LIASAELPWPATDVIAPAWDTNARVVASPMSTPAYPTTCPTLFSPCAVKSEKPARLPNDARE